MAKVRGGSVKGAILFFALIQTVDALRCHNSFTVMRGGDTSKNASVDVCPSAQSGMNFERPTLCLTLHAQFLIPQNTQKQSDVSHAQVMSIRFGVSPVSRFLESAQFLTLNGKCLSFPAHRFPRQWLPKSDNQEVISNEGAQVEACGCKTDFCNSAQSQTSLLVNQKGAQIVLIAGDGITMSHFDEDRMTSSTLKVTCVMRQHLVILPIRFAQAIAPPGGGDVDELKLIYIRPEKVVTENSLTKNNDIVVTATTVFHLDQSARNLKKIYCFGGPLDQNFGIQSNASRPINVKDPAAPTIALGPKVLKPGSRDTSQLYLNFEENSLNQTIICEAFGNPLPTIEWTSQNKGFPKPVETIQSKNDGVKSRVSRVSFPKVFPTVAGIYDCEAKNFLGTSTGQIILSVESGKLITIDPGKPSGHDKDKENRNGNQDEGKNNAIIIVAIVCPIVIVLIVMAIFVALMWRHMRVMNLHLRNLTEEEVRDFVYGNSNFDPNNAHAPIEALPFNSSLEIPRHLIDLDRKRILGSGQYGVVMQGYIKQEPVGGGDGGKGTLVAMKTVKPNVNVDTFKALLAEIKIMAYLGRHEHIACLIGACTTNIRQREVLAAVEFCAKGDLHNFLKNHRPSFQDFFKSSITSKSVNVYQNQQQHQRENSDYENSWNLSTLDLIKFSHGVASGMEFLTTKNVIHGDLAARNVLLTEDLVVKVSDFGLSRRLVEYTNYVKKSRQIPLPFKWLSLEALRDLNFSIKSDVWSYGITMWEIYSLAETPYPGYNWDENFLEKLAAGYRMKCPEFADEQIYNIMLTCWEKEPEARPTFFQIRSQMETILCQIQKPLKKDHGK